MRKMQNTTVRQSRTSATRHNRRTSTHTNRLNCWRDMIRRSVVQHSDAYHIPPQYIEEIEGRPVADIMLDLIATWRGVGVDSPNAEQTYNRDVDDMIERDYRAPIVRKHHEKIVRAEVHRFLALEFPPDFMNGENLRAFLRKFYRKGDIGMREAVKRAVLASIGREAEA